MELERAARKQIKEPRKWVLPSHINLSIQRKRTCPVAGLGAEAWRFQDEQYAWSPLSSCSLSKTHSFTMLDVDLGTFPGATLVKWGKRGISLVIGKTEFRFLDHVDVTWAGTFVIYC